MIQRIAVRAVVFNGGRVLIIRESENYKGGTQKGRYDFPGGKVKPGETLLEAIKRETKEECGLDIVVEKNPFFVGEWRPVVNKEQLQIFGVYFKCETRSRNVVLGSDHDNSKWILPTQHSEYDLIPPNEKVLKSLI